MAEQNLEELVRERQDRRRDALARARGEVVQRVAHWLVDLRLSDNPLSLQDFETRALSRMSDIRRGIEEVRGVQTGYATALAEQEREATRLKAELEQMDSLDASRQRRFEQYHLAVADAMVYREAREAIEVSRTELERGFQQGLRNLEKAVERYVDEKTMAMVKEAERVLEEARGKMTQAQQLQQRAATFEEEFRQRYGLVQEGNDGTPTA